MKNLDIYRILINVLFVFETRIPPRQPIQWVEIFRFSISTDTDTNHEINYIIWYIFIHSKFRVFSISQV